jgi:GAF domain-containing protein
MAGSLERLDDHLDEVTSALEALTATMDREPEIGIILQAVCEQVTRVIPDADMASITLITDGTPRTAASTDQRAAEIDSAQYACGEGPCLRAATTGQITRVDVATARDLWPQFTDSAQALGVGSYLAAPLPLDDGISGAVNLFGFGTHGFEDLEAKLLDLYTTVVIFGLRSTHRYLAARKSAEHLQQALVSRSAIDQAKGILRAVHKISADEAFAMLVKLSQDRNQKLNDVAAQFVDNAAAAIEDVPSD